MYDFDIWYRHISKLSSSTCLNNTGMPENRRKNTFDISIYRKTDTSISIYGNFDIRCIYIIQVSKNRYFDISKLPYFDIWKIPYFDISKLPHFDISKVSIRYPTLPIVSIFLRRPWDCSSPFWFIKVRFWVSSGMMLLNHCKGVVSEKVGAMVSLLSVG